jgi:hypothetical protein
MTFGVNTSQNSSSSCRSWFLHCGIPSARFCTPLLLWQTVSLTDRPWNAVKNWYVEECSSFWKSSWASVC